VMELADLDVGVGIGFDFIRHDDSLHHHREEAGKEIPLVAAASASFFCALPLRLVLLACRILAGRFGL
jgi:hypothetical protein